MPKKEWTDAERQAFADKMKAARAARTVPEVKPEEIKTDNQSDLQRQVIELSAKLDLLASMQGVPQGPQVGPRGMVGTYEKYIVDPKHYPDPTDQLRQEPRLKRFAFDINYDLSFEVQTTSYETKDGINQKEPRFIVELIYIIRDPETGEPTDQRAILRKMTFHEDPQAAIVVARQNNIEPDNYPGGEAQFLNDMRYLRVRDWLLEAFYPPKNDVLKQNKHDEVIGGRIVEVYTVNSQNTARIPFDQMTKKL